MGRPKGSKNKAAAKKVMAKKRRGVAIPSVPLTPEELGWEMGITCVGCHTNFRHTPFPLFQEKDAKPGKYDMTRQLPHTSPQYPQCHNCCARDWHRERRRWGM